MIILSLFDGMSCGQIALNRIGIKYDKYYSSEIDKYAIKVTQANYPDTIQLGDINNWKSWDIEKPDLIIGGSPCQGFSFAGKQLNFDDPRSKLFFVFVDILKYYKPKYFLLENVIMKSEHNDVISGMLGEIYPECVKQAEFFRTGRLEPIEINSALVSAQNRRRLYWTNIPNVTQPEDKGIMLKDIIEDAETEKEKSYCVDANYYKGASEEQYKTKSRRQLVKAARVVGRRINPKTGKRDDYNENITPEQQIEINENFNKTNCLTSVQKDNILVKQLPHGNNKGFEKELEKTPSMTTSDWQSNNLIQVNPSKECGGKQPHIQNRVYSENGKSPALSVAFGDRTNIETNTTWRKLTPLECERLQTVPDNYTNYVSNTQRYKMLGNGWTVDVIAHIFKNLT